MAGRRLEVFDCTGTNRVRRCDRVQQHLKNSKKKGI